MTPALGIIATATHEIVENRPIIPDFAPSVILILIVSIKIIAMIVTVNIIVDPSVKSINHGAIIPPLQEYAADHPIASCNCFHPTLFALLTKLFQENVIIQCNNQYLEMNDSNGPLSFFLTWVGLLSVAVRRYSCMIQSVLEPRGGFPL